MTGIDLHSSLRRVIATTPDPDAAAHRVVNVFAGWLRERAIAFGDEEAYGEASTAKWMADELEAGTVPAETSTEEK